MLTTGRTTFPRDLMKINAGNKLLRRIQQINSFAHKKITLWILRSNVRFWGRRPVEQGETGT